MSFAIAMRAPVLPADTAACASPFCTASSASHMLVPLPRRTAWLGLSSIAISVSVWMMRDLAANSGCFSSSARINDSLPVKMKLKDG